MNQQLLATESEISVPEPANSPPGTGDTSASAQPPTSCVRVGAVSYLNSKPLVEDLSELLPEATVSLDYPSRLADQLAAGDLDVALIPSVEYMRGTDYEIISDACVATRGPVLSVKLYSRVDPGAIRTLALDEGSRTSATLARIMLLERYGVDPARKPLPIEMSVQHTDADAVLVIGDRAMHAPNEKFHTVWDLGEEWLAWTGLPFVFAMWVARRGVASSHVEQMLSESRDRGVARISDIAQREASKLNIPAENAERYLTDNLFFRLTSAERSGLRLFQQLAVQAGLAPEGVDLVFRN
jgi:chorismate dehydratase